MGIHSAAFLPLPLKLQNLGLFSGYPVAFFFFLNIGGWRGKVIELTVNAKRSDFGESGQEGCAFISKS